MSTRAKGVSKGPACVSPRRHNATLIGGLSAAALAVVLAVFLLMPKPMTTTVNISIATDFSVEVFEGSEYTEKPAYFVNGMGIIGFYIDASFLDIARDAFAENSSAILGDSLLDNETIGFGYFVYYLPLGTLGNESIHGESYTTSMTGKIIVPSIILSITNTTDTFDVEGGIESHFTFIDALFSDSLNKTIFDECVGELFVNGDFNLVMTGCQYFNSTTSRIFGSLNGNDVTLDSEFFTSP